MGRGVVKAKQDQEEWKANHVPIQGLNAIGPDAYFVRLKDNNNLFIHPDPESETEEDVAYTVAEGAIGAAIFHGKQADNFIFHAFISSKVGNLEKVPVKEVIGNDNSLN